MGIDGPTFVPRSGKFLPIDVKVCLKKLPFSSFLSQSYELAFLKKCWLFHTRNLCPSFWLFWLPYFHNFVQIFLEGHFLTKRVPLTTKITIFNVELR